MLGSVVGRVIKCGLGWCVLSRIEPLQSYHPDSRSHQLQADIESLPAVGIVLVLLGTWLLPTLKQYVQTIARHILWVVATTGLIVGLWVL